MTASDDPRSCPDPERLGAFFEGTLDEPSRVEVAQHVEQCDWCLFALRQASGFEREQQSGMPAPVVSSQSSGPRGQRVVALAAGLILAVVAVAAFIGIRRGDAVGRMAAAARQAHLRPFEGRIAEFDAERYSNTRSGTTEHAALVMVANGVLKDKAAPRSEADRRAVALAQLIVGRESDAVRGLQALTRIDPQSARYRSDLAVARIALGTSANDATELRRALSDTDEALRLDPSSLDALFNRALALERLGANAEAGAAYDTYLQRDPSSVWATEARWRIFRLRPSSP